MTGREKKSPAKSPTPGTLQNKTERKNTDKHVFISCSIFPSFFHSLFCPPSPCPLTWKVPSTQTDPSHPTPTQRPLGRGKKNNNSQPNPQSKANTTPSLCRKRLENQPPQTSKPLFSLKKKKRDTRLAPRKNRIPPLDHLQPFHNHLPPVPLHACSCRIPQIPALELPILIVITILT